MADTATAPPHAKRRRLSAAEAPGQLLQAKFAPVLAWLKAREATHVDRLRIDASEIVGGGAGLFTSAAVPPGGTLAVLPRSCVLSADKALRSALGMAARAAFPSPSGDAFCSDKFVLFMWMAAGCVAPSHPFHDYLRTLPEIAPDVASWDDADVEPLASMLASTNLGVAAAKDRKRLTDEYNAVVPHLQSGPTGKLFKDVTLRRVRWARGMFRSRTFPAAICPRQSVSVMLPWMDQMNHRRGVATHWHCLEDRSSSSSSSSDAAEDVPASSAAVVDDGGAVLFRSDGGIAKDGEVFYNYGSRSNEQLAVSYGFTLFDHPFDTYGLSLSFRLPGRGDAGTSGGVTTTTTLGPFRIRRASATWAQVPDDLWRALADPARAAAAVAAAAAATQEQKQGKVEERGKVEEAEEEGDAVELEAEHVEMLLMTLRSRLAPFKATADRDLRLAASSSSSSGGGSKGSGVATSAGDDNGAQPSAGMIERMACIARYRDGQRRVLEECVETLEEMLGLRCEN